MEAGGSNLPALQEEAGMTEIHELQQKGEALSDVVAGLRAELQGKVTELITENERLTAELRKSHLLEISTTGQIQTALEECDRLRERVAGQDKQIERNDARLERLREFVRRVADFDDYTHDEVDESKILHDLQRAAQELIHEQ